MKVEVVDVCRDKECYDWDCDFWDDEECRCTKYDPDPIELTPYERECLDRGINPWYKGSENK